MKHRVQWCQNVLIIVGSINTFALTRNHWFTATFFYRTETELFYIIFKDKFVPSLARFNYKRILSWALYFTFVRMQLIRYKSVSCFKRATWWQCQETPVMTSIGLALRLTCERTWKSLFRFSGVLFRVNQQTTFRKFLFIDTSLQKNYKFDFKICTPISRIRTYSWI